MEKILNKVLEELKKEKPDNSYLRGMVETLIEMNDSNNGLAVLQQIPLSNSLPILGAHASNSTTPRIGGGYGGGHVNEGKALDALAGANVEKIKRLSEESQG